jgi:hypothetical protein
MGLIMKKRRSLLLLFGIMVTMTFLSVYTPRAENEKATSPQSFEKRADVITIDALKRFGRLERPEVEFFHDQHTGALEKLGKDCQTCHLSENNHLSYNFKRLKDTSRKEVMEIYHGECMVCHKDMYAEGEKTGPIEICGDCHLKKPRSTSIRNPMGLDKSLHFRHSKAFENKCEQCHHEYNEKTEKLFYAKGKEGSCRYCHKAETEENRISLELASHQSCIDCHRERLLKKEIAGPIDCSGCHEPDQQQKIKKAKDVPRLDRNQPDAVLIQAMGQGQDKKKPVAEMNPVPFDHQAHEGYKDTCLVCHHEDLNSCNSCHNLAGSTEGGDIKLEEAMHGLGNEQSCLGCHEIEQRQKECSGCHASMDKGLQKETASCLRCHTEPLSGNSGNSNKPALTAGNLLNSRRAVTGTYSSADIPEKVIIEALTQEYGAVELPHRKIVQTLVKNIQDSKLANYFHRDKGTICQGCHHNSPMSKTPPSCVSCHSKPFDEKNPFRPGLKAAYHLQCMGCHDEMGIEQPKSTECTDCHEAVGKSELYES